MTQPTDELFAAQWHFGRLGDIETIWEEFTGAGVHVGIYDSGIQYTHPDLAANYDPTRHLVIGATTFDGVNIGNDGHGTSVAGLIAAARNGQGVVGIAYGAMLTGINIFDPASSIRANGGTDFQAAIVQSANFDVVNNSWNSTPEFAGSQNLSIPGSFDSQTAAGWASASASGRGGLGTVVVQSAGNHARNADGDGLNVSRHTITVAAVGDSGFAASYSNHGASVLISAPGNEFQDADDLGIVTTDLISADGFNFAGNPSDYTDAFGGTSAAGPIVAAVAALMLDANPNLGWRDVQDILALSATHTGSAINDSNLGPNEDGFWTVNGAANWNGGGMHFSTNYGYGMVNAYSAVRMAEAWSLFGPARTSFNEIQSATSAAGPLALPDLAIVDATFTLSGGLTIDHVSVFVDIVHANFIDLDAYLIAPDGTSMRLLDGSAGDVTTATGGMTWTFGVEGMRGMDTAGTWTVRFQDVIATNSGTLNSASLTFYGSSAGVDSVYHYTDEFVTMAMLAPSRHTLADGDGGIDWLDLAAMSGNLSIDLRDLAYSQVNGAQLFRIAAGTVIENVVSGDGRDVLRGNAVANQLLGMRGNDELFGFEGSDTLKGGTGDDRLDGGADADTLEGGAGDDTYINPAGDTIVEIAGAAGGAHDKVQSAAGFSLSTAPNVEDVTLTGTANVNIIGNNAANVLTGNAGNNIINAGGGADTLNGGAGVDTLNGGNGSDVYLNPEAIDIIVEAAGNPGGVHDTIVTAASFNLATVANVEDIALTGTANVNAIGNNFANSLLGNAGKNTLNGGGGNDVLAGGAGNDTLNGGAGFDIFRFEGAGAGADTIAGFSAAQDLFDLLGNAFTARVESAGNTTLTHAGGTILVTGVTGLALTDWNALVISTARTFDPPTDYL